MSVQVLDKYGLKFLIPCLYSNDLHCDPQVTDGERLQLAVKDLGSCDLYPQVMLPYTSLSLLILSKADHIQKI
jgi:hypothetical protein